MSTQSFGQDHAGAPTTILSTAGPPGPPRVAPGNTQLDIITGPEEYFKPNVIASQWNAANEAVNNLLPLPRLINPVSGSAVSCSTPDTCRAALLSLIKLHVVIGSLLPANNNQAGARWG